MRGGLGVALAVMLAACEPAEAPAPVVPTRAVTVKVVDPRGADLMGAELSLDDAPFMRRPDGGFRLEGVSEGKPHRLRARSEGHLDQALTLPFGSTVTVVLEPFARLTGRVIGSDGGLVPAFTVRTGALTTSSTDGGFALELKTGAWTLEVEAPGFAKQRVETTAPGDVVIGLEPGATFVGRVRELDGTPFKGARVTVSADQGTTTDDEGRFELGGLRAGTYQVHVEAPRGDLPPWLAMMERSVRAGERLELDFREAEGALLSGTVVNQRGQPVVNALVTVASRRATTDAKGRFVFRTLPAGAVTVIVEAPHTEAVSVQATAPDSKLVVKVEEPSLIIGRVVDERGAPLKNFRVDFHDFADDAGRFSLPVIEHQPGSFFFDAAGFARKILAVDTKAGRTDVGDVKLSRGRRVSGVVTDQRTGKPLGGALVDVSSRRAPGKKVVLSESYGAVKADDAGRFSLLVDPTSVFIMASSDGYPPLETKLSPSATTANLALDPGGVVTVRVLDAEGVSVRAAQVVFTSGDELVTALPAKEGDGFVARGLAPGEWTINVSAAGRAFYPRTLKVRSAEQAVEFKEATSVHAVTVRVPGADQLVIAPGGTAAAGKTVTGETAERVPPGKWTIVASRLVEGRVEVSMHTLVVLDKPNQKDVTVAPRWMPVR